MQIEIINKTYRDMPVSIQRVTLKCFWCDTSQSLFDCGIVKYENGTAIKCCNCGDLTFLDLTTRIEKYGL